MDISKASNLERFVFDMFDRDADRTKSLFEDHLRDHGSFDLASDPSFEALARRFGFRSGKSTHADRLATLRETWQHHDTVIDPHTADGLKVARMHARPGVPMIVLETALPVKFAGMVKEALGREPERPQRFVGIEDLPKRFQVLPADAQAVKTYITKAVPVRD
jgi:threonine synthase